MPGEGQALPGSDKSSEGPGLWLAHNSPDPTGNRDEGSLRGRLSTSASYQFSTGHAWRFITAMAYLWEQNCHPTPVTLPAQLSPADSFLLLAPFGLIVLVGDSSWGGPKNWHHIRIAWPQTRGPLEVSSARSMSLRVTILDSSGASLPKGAVCPGTRPGFGERYRVILGTTPEAAGQGTLCVPSGSCWLLAGPYPSSAWVHSVPRCLPPSLYLLTQSIGQ